MITQLHTHATRTPRAPALWHRSRGQWHGWRWEDVLHDVTALAGALHAHGIARDSRVILRSESRPEALIALLACHWLGATPVATNAPHALAETPEDADTLRATGHDGAITLIDPIPGAPDLADVTANAPPPPPPIATPETAATHPPQHAFCQAPLLDPTEFAANILPLLRDGGTMSFPERPDTAATDLAEARPQRFSATSAQWQALHDDLIRRVPHNRLAWPFAASRLRRQLGLDRARLLLSHGGPLPPATTTFFAAIGLTLTAFPADAVPR